MITQKKYASGGGTSQGGELRRERMLEGKVIGRVKTI